MQSTNRTYIHQVSEEMLQKGFPVKLTVGGISMFPYLLNKEQVKVIPVTAADLSVGDIVVFKQNDKWIGHRLLRKTGGRFFTKGDFCIRKDAALTEKEVLGKIAGVYRNNQFINFESPARKRLHRFLAKISTILPPIVWLSLKFVRLKKQWQRN